jgi:hypothetical protein
VRRLLVSALVLTALTGSSGAWAARVEGTAGADRLRGTSGPDTLFGRGGNDFIDGRGGRDVLSGGVGNDSILSAGDGAPDVVSCGPGRDVVNADLGDAVAPDCEAVSRELSRDPYRNPIAQHETEVEPDSFAWGSTIVTTFQVGRYVDGGAMNIGFATSRDRGRTWSSGLLPGLSLFSPTGGIFERVSDPVIAYDSVHRVWLIGSLGLAGDEVDLAVSRSRDGVSWSQPVIAARGAEFDKEWITCDNWRRSRFRGRCYLSYLEFTTEQIQTRTSGNGGLSWSAPGSWELPRGLNAIVNGVQPVARPDGSLTVVFAVFDAYRDVSLNEIAALRSVDGGRTFAPPVHAASLWSSDMYPMRAPPLPSAAVDSSGRIWVAWSDCRFATDCDANGIVLVNSRNGVTWSRPHRVGVGDARPTVDHFLPGLAVSGYGGRTKVAVAYYSLPQQVRCDYSCGGFVDAWLSLSRDAGATWAPAHRLSVQPMPLRWIAEADIGRMLGDYISTSFVRGRPVPVLSFASQPTGGRFKQAIFAATRVTTP